MKRERLLLAVEAISHHPDSEEAELVDVLVHRGFGKSESELLVALLPIAFGRPLLEKLGVTELASEISVPKHGGGWVQVPLNRFEMYEPALSLARDHWRTGLLGKDAYEAIALRSVEVAVANQALNEGVAIKGATITAALIGPPYAEDLGFGSVLSRIRRVVFGS